MNKILDVMDDIKQKITDNEYKIIMDSLMEIYKSKEDKEEIINLKWYCNILKNDKENLKRQLEYITNSIKINNRSQYSISPLYL